MENTNITQVDLDRLKQIRIKDAKALYESMPFITKTYMANRGFPMEFLKANWSEITNEHK